MIQDLAEDEIQEMCAMSIASKLQRAASTCTSITSSISSSKVVVPVFGGVRMTAAATAMVSSNDHDRHEIMRTAVHQLQPPNSRSSILVTPPPKQLLMLEGDDMYISPNGKSHTVYQLEYQNVSRSSSSLLRREQITLEEVYDIESAKKTISLHIDSTSSCGVVMGGGMASNQHRIGRSNSIRTIERQQSIIQEEREEKCCVTFGIQEINNGVLNGSGTGSMSWDSSIVMGLYFTQHPNELHGNILELGSGVGLGGCILSLINNPMSSHLDERKEEKSSMTLTDINDDVLNMLRQNVMNSTISTECISIQKLDWFDYLDTSIQRRTDEYESDDGYDTIIASDCAYLHQQVVPLSNTIMRLLSKSSSSKLHMFAPYNRGVVHELIDELHTKDMHVIVDEIELSKYRIKQQQENIGHNMSSIWNENRSTLNEASCCRSKFLHIVAWHKTEEEIDEERRRRNEDHSMDDID